MSDEYIPAFLTEAGFPQLSTTNGLVFCGHVIPEEIVIYILSYLDVQKLLRYCLVCQQWNALIKSCSLWTIIYRRKYNQRYINLPWYVYFSFLTTNYFNSNIIINQNQSECNVEYFRNQYPFTPVENTSPNSEVTNYSCAMHVVVLKTHLKGRVAFGRYFQPIYSSNFWIIKFATNKLFLYIIDKFKPCIFIKNYGSIFEVQHGIFRRKLATERVLLSAYSRTSLRRAEIPNQRVKYEEVEVSINKYPQGIRGIVLEAKLYNHTVPNFPNGSIMFLFDSINGLVEENIACMDLDCSWKVLPS